MRDKFETWDFEKFILHYPNTSYEKLCYMLYQDSIRVANVIWDLQNAVGAVQSNMMSMAETQKTFNESTIEALNNLVKVDSIHHQTIKVMNKNIKFNHDINWLSILLHGVSISYILITWGK